MGHSYRNRILIGIAFIVCSFPCTAGEDTWIEAKSPNFVVISNASPKQARRTARSFEQFRSLLQATFPKLKADPEVPLHIFAVRDNKSLKALLPAQQGKGAAQPAGIFMSGPERNYVVLRTDAPGDQAYHVVYHEYVHMVMHLNFRRLPVWLSEGLAEFFGYASISEGSSALGDPNPDMLRFLQAGPLMPLPVLMSVTQDSPYYRQQGKVQIFYAQSWAITHYLMVGDKQAHAGQLSEFLRLLQMDVPEDEAAERALGNLNKLEQNLSNYVRMNAFYHYQIPVKLTVKEDQYAVRTLSAADSLASRGQVLVSANRLDEARAMLEQALQTDPRSASANEGMGLLYMRLKDQEKALEYFSAAAELDSNSFLAHFYAAQLAYYDTDSSVAEKHLRKAIAINPEFAPAYRNLSQLLMMQESRLKEALESAQKAMELDPADLGHCLHYIRVLIAMGSFDQADKLAETLRAASLIEEDRGRVETLRLMIEDGRRAAAGKQRRAETLKSKTQAMREQHGKTKDKELAEQRQIDAATWKQQTPAGPVKTGAAGQVRGIIQSVKCDFPAVMDVMMDVSGKKQKFRAQNYYEVQFGAVGAPGKNNFEPCEELEGKQVKIEFLSVSGQEFFGLIKSIIIE